MKLFNNIVDFVHDQLNNDPQSSEPARKRQRVDVAVDVDVAPPRNGQPSSNGASMSSPDDVLREDALLEIKDISVSIPQRKKLDLCFTAKHLYARAPGTIIPIPSMIFPWKSIGMHTIHT